MPEFDFRDAAILADRELLFNRNTGPRVGDFVRLADGTLHRFTHDWSPKHGIQITSSLDPAQGSFHLSRVGLASYSGGLDPCIPYARIRDTGEKRKGRFWFFHHDYATAHNGVNVEIECRVYEVIPADAIDWAHQQGQALQRGAAVRDCLWTPDEIKAAVEYNKTADPREPRRLLPGMHPIFRDHNCSRCKSGEKPCVRGNPSQCDWPHARND
jgi:hypothetical protein